MDAFPLRFLFGGEAMGYLLPTEYVAYGLTAETTDDWVTMASALMEAYCHRPSLMATEYTERLRVTSGAYAVRVSYLPLVAATAGESPVLGLQVRMGMPRRGELSMGFLEREAMAFGAAGAGATGGWTTMDPSLVDVDLQTGEVTLPVNLLGLRYNEVEISYTSGVLAVTPALKVACAQIVRNAQATPGLTVKASKVDSLQMQYFGGSLLDDGVRNVLEPYVGRRLG